MIHFIKDRWQLTLLFLIFLPILLCLGFWQLDRADEKQQQSAAYEQKLSEHPVSVTSLDSDGLQTYQRVFAQGVFNSNQYWLLDNRPRAGQVGYEVVVPLYIDNGAIILVNRGWIRSPLARDELPDIQIPSGAVNVKGHLYQPQKNAIIKHGKSDWPSEWPKRVIQLTIEELQLHFEQPLLPVLLRLDEDSDAALTTDWSIINVSVEKHLGYAFQWFSMALALCLLYVWFVYKEIANSNNKRVVSHE